MVVSGISTHGHPTTASIAMKPAFGYRAFGIIMHKGAVKIPLIEVCDGVWYVENFSIDEFFYGPLTAFWTCDLNTHS